MARSECDGAAVNTISAAYRLHRISPRFLTPAEARELIGDDAASLAIRIDGRIDAADVERLIHAAR